MARISGVDIPNSKVIGISLTYIYGIGNSISKKILKDLNIDETIRTKDLSEEQLGALKREIENYMVEGSLRREIRKHIERKKRIRCYSGIRLGRLPVRGQRTKTNARNARGGTRATPVKKKAKPGKK